MIDTLKPLSSLALLLALLPVFAAWPQTDEPPTARTGFYQATSTVAELTDAATQAHFDFVIPEDSTIDWSIYVPESYSADSPPGIIVNVSPTNKSWMGRGWKDVLDRHNLIWIGADNSGNKIMTARRMLFSLLAPMYITKHYPVNKERVYISGLSGGGRITSIVAVEFAKLFKGAIYICGVNFPRQEQPELLDYMRHNRYVFLTGSNDFNMLETKRVYHAYKNLGLEHLRLMVVPRMGHRNPTADRFEEAVRFLDSVLPEADLQPAKN